MRFSHFHLLLLGTALAAPIQDLDDAHKRSSHDVAARGLFSFLPRAPAIPLVPKVVKPPPGGGHAPPPPVKPVPHDPSTGPNSPGSDTPGLRPNDPAPGTPDGPPPPVVPADPAPVNPVEPAPVNPVEPAPVNPVEPAPVNPAEPNPAAPKPDDPNAPANNPDETTPINRDNDPDVLPESPACAIGGLGKRAVTQCVKPPAKLSVDPKSKWATNNIETQRQEGHQMIAEADQVIAAGAPDTGFKGKTDVPIDQKTDNVFTENGKYKTESDNDPMTVSDAAYVQGQPGFDMSDMTKWTESQMLNSDAQQKAFDAWVKQHRQDLLNAGHSKKDVDAYMVDQVGEGMTPSLLTSFESPSQKSMLISMSDSRKADLYRPYTYTFKGQKYERPAFGNEADPAFWSDEAMAAWRRSCKEAGVSPSVLERMARDNIETRGTINTLEAVFEQAGKKPDFYGTMTVKKGGTGTRSGGIEGASFDAVSRTVHGAGPIRMTRDHHQELGGKKVVAYHITKTAPSRPGGEPRWDMIVEFGL
jgi:hypothetical protein